MSGGDQAQDLVPRMLAGEDRALARLITLVERGAPQARDILRLTYPHAGRACLLGITGPPGAGKSTLADRLTSILRSQGLTVGIMAVDPTSPFTGGALLGDRIRMQQHYLDAGVFIRSLATRGSRGGLPRVAQGVIQLLDASGRDVILVETVGVGQTELDIVEAADTVLVVLTPEVGDAIQTMKAGLLEIADIFVVNKADREGALSLQADLQLMVEMNPRPGWRVPVLACQAAHNLGVEEVYREVERHRRALEESGHLAQRRRERRRKEFLRLVEEGVRQRLLHLMEQDGRLQAALEKVEGGELDPYSAAHLVLEEGLLGLRRSQSQEGPLWGPPSA